MRRAAANRTEKEQCPEFVVPREAFNRYFEKPLPTSTFYDLVGKGKILSFEHLQGRYLLNASLGRLGLPTVRHLPTPSSDPSREDFLRLAFTMIDPDLFPAPSWLLKVEAIPFKHCDYAGHLARQYREAILRQGHTNLKLAYFQGVLDANALIEADGVEGI